MRQTLYCDYCTQEFTRVSSNVTPYSKHYCSLECKNASESAKVVELYCSSCQRPFLRKASDVGPSKSGLRFCSRECKSSAQRLGGVPEVIPSHYGTGPKTTTKTIYRSPYPVGSLEHRRDLHLKSSFGITLEDYNKKLEEQGGVCAICHRPCKAKPSLAVDHNHSTDKVRGLLCMTCNTKLGWFESNRDAALEYLNHYED